MPNLHPISEGISEGNTSHCLFYIKE